MHEHVLLFHSYLRWLVLGCGLFAMVLAALSLIAKRTWTELTSTLWRTWVAAFDLQVLLGLTLYFLLSPTAKAGRQAGAGAIKSPILRFWVMEHPVTMILAVAALHIASVKMRRASSDAARHRIALLGTAVTLLLVAVAIPWSGRTAGRPLLRGTVIANDMQSCAEPPRQWQTELPQRLSATDLYQDIAEKRLADDARYYEPRFALWSDGAEKKRWVRIPDGLQIDSSDPDAWQFPVGTSFWKEFSLNGKRLETRLLRKFGTGDHEWAQMSYVWDAEETDAIATPIGQANVRETEHDAPTAAECSACHGKGRNAILGFSAVQLSHHNTGVTLSDLRSERLLTAPIEDVSIPGSTTAVAAVGALHANCAHCHNPQQGSRSKPRCYDPNGPFDFMLTARAAAGKPHAIVGIGVGSLIIPGNPDKSPLLQRMGHRHKMVLGMPPLASEVVDTNSIAAVRKWISEMTHVRE